MNKDEAHSQVDLESSDDHRYIIFYLGQELYATPLTATREVVEVLPTKAIPNTVESFIGVCNLRGQIVGVVDLRRRFAIPENGAEGSGVYFVFDVNGGAIAAQIDSILCVDLIPPESLDTKPNLVTKFPQKYIIGIAKYRDRLVTVVDFRSILSHEELISLEIQEKKAA